MRNTRTVLASFDTHEEAKTCVLGLLGVGFDVSFNSIAEPPSLHERFASLLSSGKSSPCWTRRGLFIGALVGFVIDTAVFPISHIEAIDLTGALASWIIAVVEWSCLLGGTGAIVGTLLGWSRKKAQVVHYQLTSESGKLLLIAFGSAFAIAHAERSLLPSAGAQGNRVLSCDRTRAIPAEI